MSYVLKVFLISVGLLCFCFVVHAETTVAKVAWVKGTFRATSNGGSRTLTGGSPIYLHDTLMTGKGSTAQIVFTDDTLMAFRANSNLYVSDYHYEPKTNNIGHYVMNLIAGGFRTVTGWIARKNPEHYQIKTPVAVIGVRGTDFTLALNKKGELFVERAEGIPTITTGAGQMALNAKTSFATVSSANSPPVALSQRPSELAGQPGVTQTTYSEVDAQSASSDQAAEATESEASDQAAAESESSATSDQTSAESSSSDEKAGKKASGSGADASTGTTAAASTTTAAPVMVYTPSFAGNSLNTIVETNESVSQ